MEVNMKLIKQPKEKAKKLQEKLDQSHQMI